MLYSGDVMKMNMQMCICNITIILYCAYTLMMSARYTESRIYAMQSIHVVELYATTESVTRHTGNMIVDKLSGIVTSTTKQY